MKDMYCLDTNNEDMKLMSTRDDELLDKDHIFWKIEVQECTSDNNLESDAACSSQAAIDDYLEGKVIQISSMSK